MKAGIKLCILLGVLILLPAAGSARAERAFGSIGLQVVPIATGELAVLHVVQGSPAAAAGVRPGDLLVKVDDRILEGSDFAEVVGNHLWGEVGTEVQIQYLRPGVSGVGQVCLVREDIATSPLPVPGVKTLKP